MEAGDEIQDRDSVRDGEAEDKVEEVAAGGDEAVGAGRGVRQEEVVVEEKGGGAGEGGESGLSAEEGKKARRGLMGRGVSIPSGEGSRDLGVGVTVGAGVGGGDGSLEVCMPNEPCKRAL